MYKYYLILRVIGYCLIGASFDKQGIPLYYVFILAIVMEVSIFINYLLDKYKVSSKTRKKIEDMVNSIDMEIKDKN